MRTCPRISPVILGSPGVKLAFYLCQINFSPRAGKAHIEMVRTALNEYSYDLEKILTPVNDLTDFRNHRSFKAEEERSSFHDSRIVSEYPIKTSLFSRFS